jgi:two-component system NarL family sensor kinase
MADHRTPPADPHAERARAVRMIVALAGCLLALGWLWAARAGHPSDGTVVSTASHAWHPGAVVVADAVGAGNPLRAGDLVTAVDGRTLTTAAPHGQAPRTGDEVTYDVTRDGSPIRVPVTLTDYPFWTLVAHHAATLPYVAMAMLLGSLLVARRPRDPAAIALYSLGVLQFIGYASSLWYGTQVIDVATGRMWVTTVAEVANCLVWACMLLFAASFPRPWPVVRRRPWLVVPAFALPFLAYAGTVAVMLPGSAGLRRSWLLVSVSVPAAALYPVLILAALVVSYVLTRDPIERHRMRIISYGVAALATGYLVLGRIPELVTGHPLISWDYFTLMLVPVQLLLAATILRYRLWDIQIIPRRSLIYGLVTAGLTLVYLGVAAAISAALDTELHPGPVLVALVMALSFSSARTALRRVVSRLVYGEREDPYEVLRQLGQRLGSAESAEVVLNQLVATLVRTLRLSHAAVEMPGLDLVSSGHGRPGPTPTSIDLVHDGERIGRLVLDPGPDREPFGPSDRRLLEGLAQQVSATAHSLLLAARLQRSLEGTVTMLEEERRRMRREIHDGLGPTIASASMRLELSRSLIRTDPDATDRILAELAEIHRSVIQDIRRLVDGLRPIILDHLGLDAAVREMVAGLGGGVRTNLDCTLGTDRLPAAVEVAAYRIVSEALTNVVRHAGASVCDVRIWWDGDIHVEVRDNGRGLPPDYRPGMGLTSIRERCAELGGTATITPYAPAGTRVICRLPVPRAARGIGV